MALIASTELCGSSRSVSRVPGAPPSTCTPATAGSSQTTTVTPDLMRCVGGIADTQAGDVGDEVARAGAETSWQLGLHELRAVEAVEPVGALAEVALVVESDRADRRGEIALGEAVEQLAARSLGIRIGRVGDLDRRIGRQRIAFGLGALAADRADSRGRRRSRPIPAGRSSAFRLAAARRRRRAQRLAAGDGQVVAELGRVAADDGDVVAVAADEDMRRAGLAQPPDKADLVVELRPERDRRRPASGRPSRLRSAASRRARGRRSCRRR